VVWTDMPVDAPVEVAKSSARCEDSVLWWARERSVDCGSGSCCWCWMGAESSSRFMEWDWDWDRDIEGGD